MSKRITDKDIQEAANLLECSTAHIRAILEVEARGRGFDSQGRPLILFEPHVFWRCLPERQRPGAQARGLAYPKWVSGKYPKDSYPRLERARAINESAAIKACSWGLGQVLGENFRQAGYSSPQELEADMKVSEGNQLIAMCNYIKNFHLDDELRESRWAAFARGYNGPGYAKHNYHGRLEAAFKKHSKGARAKATAPANSDILSLGDKNELAAELQRMLNDAGFRVAVDGDFGPATKKAVRLFQLDRGMGGTGRVDPKTWAALKEAPPAVVAEARASATEEDLKDSRIVSSAEKVRDVAKIGSGLTAGAVAAEQTGILDQVQEYAGHATMLSELVSTLQPVINFAKQWWPLAAVAGGIALWYWANKIIKARVEDHRSGRTL